MRVRFMRCGGFVVCLGEYRVGEVITDGEVDPKLPRGVHLQLSGRTQSEWSGVGRVQPSGSLESAGLRLEYSQGRGGRVKTTVLEPTRMVCFVEPLGGRLLPQKLLGSTQGTVGWEIER
jgi:hypothetical protein